MYEVGDYYEKGFLKGIVFNVDETGEHGYILALDETVAVWSYKDENVMYGTPATNGDYNCALVREMEEKPSPDTVAPQEVKKKAKPRPRLLQARIDEDNPFYQEAKRVWNGGLEEKDAESRRVILNYMEHFRMSYVTKDIDFLEQLFSERALIIVGNVVREASDDERHYLSTEKVNYNVRTKREYLDRLREIFNRNKAINVEFTDFSIRRHPTREGIYGVSVKQRYTSDIYSDEGYLFLLWDFRDETAPKIHVRTWQPRMLDEHTPLPEQEIFNIGSFNLE